MDLSADLLDILEWDSTGKREIARVTVRLAIFKQLQLQVARRWPRQVMVDPRGVVPPQIFGIPIDIDETLDSDRRTWNAEGQEVYP